MTQLSKATNQTTLSLLKKILQTPNLTAKIQALPAPQLLQIIEKIGLEDSGEILALVSHEQLVKVMDEDLWKKSGKGESLNNERMALWFQVISEMGPERAAEKLQDMDEEFLLYALSQNLFVLNLSEMTLYLKAVQAGEMDNALLEKALESIHHHEIDSYRVMAKSDRNWDVILDLLLALEKYDMFFLAQLLQRLSLLSELETERAGGLYEVLTAEEIVENDAGFSRELRRNQDGFVNASDAVAFIEWIKKGGAITDKEDPISKAYFRDFQETRIENVDEFHHHRQTDEYSFALLLEGETKAAQLALPNPENTHPLFLHIQKVMLTEPDLYAQNLMEMNFLTQVILHTEDSKNPKDKLRFQEALQKALDYCADGLQKSPDEKSMIKLFYLGYKK